MNCLIRAAEVWGDHIFMLLVRSYPVPKHTSALGAVPGDVLSRTRSITLVLATILTFVLLVPSVANAQVSHADTLIKSNYSPMSGDYNGDGVADVLMIAEKRLVFIDYEFPIPIALSAPSPNFAILSSGSGSYSVDIAPSTEMISSGVWQSSIYDVVYGDILGNGAGGLILRARSGGLPSFSIAASPSTGAPQLIQVLSVVTLGVDIGGATGEVRLGDMNGDGRADLTVRNGGVAIACFTANSQGQFIRNDESSIQAVWGSMRDALNSGDSARALLHIAPGSRSFYNMIFEETGEYLPLMTTGWSGMTPLEVLTDNSTWFMSVTAEGETFGHLVEFIKVNGNWQIATF